MMVVALAFALLFAPSGQSEAAPAAPSSRHEQAQQRAAANRQVAMDINQLAGSIHSEADALNYVDAIAKQLSEGKRQHWTNRSIRRRVARAEYEAVADSAHLIPERRVVDVWNE